MKKELKIGEKFKIFYGSTYKLVNNSSIHAMHGTPDCNFKLTFLVEINESFLNNDSEIDYDHKQKLIKEFFLNCYWYRISIVGISQIDTDNYHRNWYEMTIHCNGKLGINH